MNESVILDLLISNSNGRTFYFEIKLCPISLIKEAILRGYQIQMNDESDCALNGGGHSRGVGYGNGNGNPLEAESGVCNEDSFGGGESAASGYSGSSYPGHFLATLHNYRLPKTMREPYYIS